MARYLRLSEPPRLSVSAPQCSACDIDVIVQTDGYQCPSCGTRWSAGDGDGVTGTLAAPNETEGPTCPTARAWIVDGMPPGPARDTAVHKIAGEYTTYLSFRTKRAGGSHA